MKTLEINRMEQFIGGDNPSRDFTCGFAIGVAGGLGFVFGGPLGASLGAIGGASLFCAQEVY